MYLFVLISIFCFFIVGCVAPNPTQSNTNWSTYPPPRVDDLTITQYHNHHHPHYGSTSSSEQPQLLTSPDSRPTGKRVWDRWHVEEDKTKGALHLHSTIGAAAIHASVGLAETGIKNLKKCISCTASEKEKQQAKLNWELAKHRSPKLVKEQYKNVREIFHSSRNKRKEIVQDYDLSKQSNPPKEYLEDKYTKSDLRIKDQEYKDEKSSVYKDAHEKYKLLRHPIAAQPLPDQVPGHQFYPPSIVYPPQH